MTDEARPGFAPGAAIVAGGSGGLGSAISRLLGKSGCPIVIGYRSRAAEAETLADAVRAAGAPAAAVPLDLTDEASIEGAVAAAKDLAGGVAAAIYAAGFRKDFTFLSKTPDSVWNEVLALDVRGFLALARVTLPELRRSGGAVVSLTTYQGGRLEVRGALSSVAKAAVEKATLVVAREEGRYGVRANAVRAGWIAAGSAAALLDAETSARKRKEIPLGRVGLAEELAEAVVFLASNRASFITGAVLTVDGGESL